MAYQPQQTCPACGSVLVASDIDGAGWECRRCRATHPVREVVGV